MGLGLVWWVDGTGRALLREGLNTRAEDSDLTAAVQGATSPWVTPAEKVRLLTTPAPKDKYVSFQDLESPEKSHGPARWSWFHTTDCRPSGEGASLSGLPEGGAPDGKAWFLNWATFRGLKQGSGLGKEKVSEAIRRGGKEAEWC